MDNQNQSIVLPDTNAGNGPSETPEWLSKYPDALKTSKTLAKFKTEQDVAKSYVELEGKLGRSVEVPGKDAKPEDWDKFYSRIGRPQKADDYALEPVEGLEADPEFIKRMRAEFHEAGLSKAQAERVFKRIASEAAAGNKASKEAQAKADLANEKAIEAAWGAKAGEKLEAAKRFALRVGGENVVNYLEASGLGKNAVILQLLAAGGEALAPGKIIDGLPPKGKTQPYAYMNEGRA